MRLLRVVVAVAVAWAGEAAACEYGQGGGLNITLGPIPLALGLHVHTHTPCRQFVAVAPPVYVAPPPVYVSPPQVYAAPPMVAAPAPQVVYVPLPAPAPAPVAVAAPTVVSRVERDPGPARLAIKYLPGFNTSVEAASSSLTFGQPAFSHNVGLEFRLTNWLSLRSDFEQRAAGRSWDLIGPKLSLPGEMFSPYVSATVSGSEANAAKGRIQLGFSGAAGLDVKFGRHFFVEAEARYRTATDSCCKDPGQVTGMVGAGVALF